MWRSPEPRYDVASGIAQGGRDYQEDAIVSDFPFGMDSGVAVLADGMGGHEAGDVASKLVVTEVYSTLKFGSADFAVDEPHLPKMLERATSEANSAVREYVEDNPEAHGMGATLVATVMVENRLFWMSVGDSPLYLLRNGKLQQLNEDHSLAPQIDYMVKQGLLSEEDAKDHPDRNCLTSVIMGTKIARADCPTGFFELEMGDVLVLSSDGLQYLGEPMIQKVLHRYRRRKSAEIAGHLLEAINTLADPDQDNVSFAVLKLNHMKPVERKIAPKPIGLASEATTNVTRVVMPGENGESAKPIPFASGKQGTGIKDQEKGSAKEASEPRKSAAASN
jgi:serine/threonine protein phosphatase PrpC